MLILPIEAIHEVDQPLFGGNLYNLSALKRAGLNVPKGIVISAPEFVIQTVIKHFEDSSKEVFEQKMTLVQKEILSTPTPPELLNSLGNFQIFLIGREVVLDRDQVWRKLIDLWLNQIKSKIWREGFNQPLGLALSAKAVFFLTKRPELIEAFVDDQSLEVSIQSNQKLQLSDTESILKVVTEGNKKLYLPQIFTFAISGSLALVAVRPYTKPVAETKEKMVVMPSEVIKKVAKTTVKIFANLTSGFANINNVDGLILEAERFTGNLVDQVSFETLVQRLTEAAASTDRTIVFRLPDINTSGDVTGSLRLINQSSLLKQSADVFNFVRNKRGLINIQVGIPTVRSSLEFIEIKRELASLGIARKGMLQLWLEVTVPENLINMPQYLEVGLDGVILNLDRVHQSLCGYNLDESEFYKHEIKTLITFLQPTLKALHKERIPILATGKLCMHSDVLHFLIEQGVWGVVVNSILEAGNLPEQLEWVEKRVMTKKLAAS